jgi:uncharacterized protein (TIGR00730 family)
MNSIAIFCGSSSGNHPDYSSQARLLGRSLALKGVTLVYGGARVGLMNELAEGALEKGGKVIGVMPHFLAEKEIAHEGLSSLVLVNSMHERKMRMNELCDGVIALPGGFGTLDECFEMITWGQLGIHHKPVGILNIRGYYDALIRQMDQMVQEGFLKTMHRDMVVVSEDIPELLERMEQYLPPSGGKWIREKSG